MTRTNNHILVVGDEPELRGLVARAIQAAFVECEVLEAPDGVAAMRIARSLRPSVAVLDLEMPHMDGYELCRLIKARRNTRRCEVIAMSGRACPEDIQQIERHGARAFLSKPFRMVRLLEEVEAALMLPGTACLCEADGSHEEADCPSTG